MEAFKRVMESVRRQMRDMKNEKYALGNTELKREEEYIKSLYLRMLGTLMQYENNPNDLQALYMKRVAKGICAEAETEDYLRKALEISLTDVQEFLSYMQEKRLKYYFVLDGILIVALGSETGVSYEYLAEIVELIDIGKEELSYLCAVAKSILLQSAPLYEQAKAMEKGNALDLDLVSYIKGYYVGAIIDSRAEKYYFVPAGRKAAAVKLEDRYAKLERVTFENLEIDLEKDLNFKKCSEVIFKNCTLNGEHGTIHIAHTDRVVIQNCIFQNFENRVAVFEEVGDLYVCHNRFMSCGYSTSCGERGGVLYVEGGKVQSLTLNNNYLTNCYIKAKDGDCASGVFISVYDRSMEIPHFELKNNEFMGCKCIGNSAYPETLVGIIGRDSYCQESNLSLGQLQQVFDTF